MRHSDSPAAISIPAPQRPASAIREATAATRPGRALRVTILLLTAIAVSLFALSLAQPWWRFQLYAPQYPRGLVLVISLGELAGDVHEVNTLNHYIGMGHLDAAAAVERKYASLAVGILGIVLITMTFFARRRLARLIPMIGACFPLGFLADSMYWLHRFGHDLDPRAPLHIPVFTPQLFGNGTIGQFMTFARPEIGFWLAVAGVGLLVAGAILRESAHAARGKLA